MSNAAKIAVPFLLLAALAGGGAYFLLNSSPAPAPSPREPAPIPTQADPTPGPAPVVVQPQGVQEPERTAADPSTRSANDRAPQGVRGRVVLPTGAAAAGIPVLLLESSANDPFKVFLDRRMGKVSTALATSRTAADGTFALGLNEAGKTYDLRIVADEYPEKNLSLKVRVDEWYETGTVALEQGAIVQGRVIDEATQGGVGEATVFLADSSQSHAMLATPGRERGISAHTDANGNFRFVNAPHQGLINLSVEASGYATNNLVNQQVKPDVTNEFSIALAPGQPIGGVVVDATGAPIAGASITATAISAKTPQTASAASDADGRFQFESLRSGPYSLVTTSSQFAETKTPMVTTGDLDVKVVLSQKAFVKLRVLAANGSPIKSFRVSLKRYFANNPLGIGNVMEFQDRDVTPRDYSDNWALVKGVPSGEFRFQVTDRDHAKTLSEPFTVVEGGDPTEVVMTMTLGAIIQGTVVDDAGKPVARAKVTTDLNAGIAADTALFDMFRSMMPEKHSVMQTETDAQGRFRLTKLAYADYMVRVSHPDFCEAKAIDIKLENEGQIHDAGVIALARGTLVEGMTTIAGEAAGQIKVTLSIPPEQNGLNGRGGAQGNQPEAQARALFSAFATSGGDGRFQLLKRVPPGTYKVHASRQSTSSPFDALIDMRETEQMVTIAPGQDRATVNFNLTKR